jgi:hypothetical protein
MNEKVLLLENELSKTRSELQIAKNSYDLKIEDLRESK